MKKWYQQWVWVGLAWINLLFAIVSALHHCWLAWGANVLIGLAFVFLALDDMR